MHKWTLKILHALCGTETFTGMDGESHLNKFLHGEKKFSHFSSGAGHTVSRGNSTAFSFPEVCFLACSAAANVLPFLPAVLPVPWCPGLVVLGYCHGEVVAASKVKQNKTVESIQRKFFQAG